MLAGLLKGPSYFNPDRHPDRAKERLTYVLGRMQEDGVISAEQKDEALAAPPKLVACDRPHRDSGFHFVDFLGREAKTDGVESLTAQSYTVHSTINAHTAARRRSGAAGRPGALRDRQRAACSSTVRKPTSPTPCRSSRKPREPTRAAHMPAVAAGAASGAPAALRRALDAGGHRAKGAARGATARIRVGLPDGRIMPLTGLAPASRRSLGLYDVVYVTWSSRQAKSRGQRATPRPTRQPKPTPTASSGQAQLRVRPTVQGAALVLENKTGRILAMAGSFSYPLSQLNRTCADPAPARLGDQADHLSHGAAEGAAAEHAGARRSDHAAADRQRGYRQRSSRVTTAATTRARRITGRRATPTTARAASTRCGAAWRIRSTSSPRICSTAASTPIRRRASTRSAPPRWRRRSTPNACAIIRSCSARSRCA